MNLHDLRLAQACFSVADVIEGRKQLNKLRAAKIDSSSLSVAETWTETKISPEKSGCHFVSICN
jgi:hypothetical protein